MKLQKHLPLLLIAILLCISCESPAPPNVDTKANVYKQLSAKYNGGMDSLIQKIEKIEVFQDLKRPVKVVSTKDEMEIITEVINVSITGMINMDSLGMTKNNTMLLKNKNNVSGYNFRQIDSTNALDGYNVKLIGGSYNYGNIGSVWGYALSNYEERENDSITENYKRSIESQYERYIQTVNDIKFVVLEEDKLLIPPVLDLKQDGFISGYIVTHLTVFDINSQEQVAQTMVISSNSDEVSYMSYSQNSTMDQFKEATLRSQLKSNLINQRKKMIDSVFLFNNIQLLR